MITALYLLTSKWHDVSEPLIIMLATIDFAIIVFLLSVASLSDGVCL